MNDLEIYKNNSITNNLNTYNQYVKKLYTSLLINIKNIQNSRLSNVTKQKQINSILNIYNSNVNELKKQLDKSILSIKNFTPQNINISKNKNALLIGINYTGTINELYGCINDVNLISERLTSNGFKNINILTDLTTKKATKNNILQDFKNLLINSQSGDLLFFVFSGHGTFTYDKNNDELDRRDEMIISSDLQGIIDDELKQLIQTYLKQDVTLFALFDSCFSGSVLDLKYQYMDTLNYNKFTENSKQLETKGNVIMISGCTDLQTSADSTFNNKPNGALTWSLLECLKTNSNCTWRELVQNMRNLLKTSQFTQIPQLSSGSFVDIDSKIFI